MNTVFAWLGSAGAWRALALAACGWGLLVNEADGSARNERAPAARMQAPTLSIAVDFTPIVEGATASFTIRASHAPATQLSVRLDLQLEGAGSYLGAAPPPSVQIFPAGVLSVKYLIVTEHVEGFGLPGSIGVALAAGNGYTVNPEASSARVWVRDIQPLPSLSLADASAAEGGALVFELRLSQALQLDADFSWAAGADTMADQRAEAADFPEGFPSGTLTIGAGALSGAFIVLTADDERAEGEEAFIVRVTGLGGQEVSAKGLILDNDESKDEDDGDDSGKDEGDDKDEDKDKDGGDDGDDSGNDGSDETAASLVSQSSSPLAMDMAGEAGQQVNAALMPHLALSLAGETSLLASGRITEAFARSDADVAQPQGLRAARLNVWARGYQRRLDGPRGESLGFQGDLGGGLAGFDARLQDALVVGLGLSATRSRLDFGGALPGRYEAELQGVHPYLGWRLPKGGLFWTSVGLGLGQLSIQGEAGGSAYTRDLKWQSLALGGYSPLRALAGRDSLNLSLVADALAARMTEDRLEGLEAEVGLARLGLKLDYARAAASRSQFGAGAQLTARRDFGDALEGLGLELGGNLHLEVASLGLKFALSGRGLLAHADSLKDWGLSASLKWTRRPDGRGLSLAFKPRIGALTDRSGQVWQGASGLHSPAASQAGLASYWLEAEYGLPIRHGQERLVFFASRDLRGRASPLSLGARLALDAGFTAEYEAWRQPGLPLDHRLRLRYARRF